MEIWRITQPDGENVCEETYEYDFDGAAVRPDSDDGYTSEHTGWTTEDVSVFQTADGLSFEWKGWVFEGRVTPAGALSLLAHEEYENLTTAAVDDYHYEERYTQVDEVEVAATATDGGYDGSSSYSFIGGWSYEESDLWSATAEAVVGSDGDAGAHASSYLTDEDDHVENLSGADECGDATCTFVVTSACVNTAGFAVEVIE